MEELTPALRQKAERERDLLYSRAGGRFFERVGSSTVAGVKNATSRTRILRGFHDVTWRRDQLLQEGRGAIVRGPPQAGGCDHTMVRQPSGSLRGGPCKLLNVIAQPTPLRVEVLRVNQTLCLSKGAKHPVLFVVPRLRLSTAAWMVSRRSRAAGDQSSADAPPHSTRASTTCAKKTKRSIGRSLPWGMGIACPNIRLTTTVARVRAIITYRLRHYFATGRGDVES